MKTQTQTKTKTIVGVALAVITIGVLGFAVGMYYYGSRSSTSASTPLSLYYSNPNATNNSTNSGNSEQQPTNTNSSSGDKGNQKAVKLVDKGCINPCDLNGPGTKKCTLVKDGENICADGDGCTVRFITRYNSKDGNMRSYLSYLYQNDNDWISYPVGGGVVNFSAIHNGDNKIGAQIFAALLGDRSGGVFTDYPGDGGETSADAVSLHLESGAINGAPIRLIICD